jgi:hypothetical protein
VAPGWVNKLSPAVIEGAAKACANLYQKSGRVGASDVRRLAAVAGVFFDHLSEIGALDYLEAGLRQSGVLNTSPTWLQIQEFRERTEKTTGVKIDEAAFNRVGQAQQTNWFLLKERLDGGLSYHSLLRDFVSNLESMADELERQGRGQAARPTSLGYLRYVDGQWCVSHFGSTTERRPFGVSRCVLGRSPNFLRSWRRFLG